MKINMEKWVSDICGNKKRIAMPLATYPGVEITGRRVIDIVKDGQSQYECIKALSERFPSAAAVTVMDLSVEAEAFGSPINFLEEDTPTVAARIVQDMDDVNKLAVPAINAGRTGEYIKAVRLASENIMDRPVFAGMIGPYSLAGRLFDLTEIMMAIILEPELIHALLKKCTEFLVSYAQALKGAGANGIVIAEPAAGLLSPALCQEFSSDYVKQIVSAVQDAEFMVILHNCGNTVKLVESMLSTGSKGFHFGNIVDLADILPQVPSDRLVFGNIDPAGMLKGGTVEGVTEATLKLLEKTKDYKNFVLSSGCDVPPGTPLLNLRAFYDALDMYNSR